MLGISVGAFPQELSLGNIISRSKPAPLGTMVGETPGLMVAKEYILGISDPQEIRVAAGIGSQWSSWSYEIRHQQKPIFHASISTRYPQDGAIGVRLVGNPPYDLLVYQPMNSGGHPQTLHPEGYWLYRFDGQEYVQTKAVLTNRLSLFFRNPLFFKL